MTQPIRNVYINGRFLTQPVTGVQRYAHEIVKAFDRFLESGQIDPERYQVTLLSPNRHLQHQLSLRRIQVKRFGQYSGHAWEQWELPFHAWNGVLFCPGNTAPLMSYLFRRPVVVTIHSLAFRLFPEAYSRFFRVWYHFLTPRIIRFSRAVITVSESERRTIEQLYPEASGKIQVIQNGGLPTEILNRRKELFRRPVSFPEPYALFVGSLSEGKNLKAVLRAVEQVNQHQPLHLVVVGSTARTFRESTLEIPPSLTGKVHFTDQVEDPSELIPLYHHACCLVFPSFYEASSLPPIEAMACECPVIASDIPALRERCGEAALYCPPEEPDSIARAIQQIRTNPDLRQQLIRKGQQQATQFTWEASARQTFQILEQVF